MRLALKIGGAPAPPVEQLDVFAEDSGALERLRDLAPPPATVIPRDPKDCKMPFPDPEWQPYQDAISLAKRRRGVEALGDVQFVILHRILDCTRAQPPQPVDVKAIVTAVLDDPEHDEYLKDLKGKLADHRR